MIYSSIASPNLGADVYSDNGKAGETVLEGAVGIRSRGKRSILGTKLTDADQAKILDEEERQMLLSGSYGDDRWAQSLLIARGLLSYRRRYLVFGPRMLRVTMRGRKILREL